MKRSLAILLTLLTFVIFLGGERVHCDECVDYATEQLSFEDAQYSFSQGDNFVDTDGRRGSASSSSTLKLATERSTSCRRGVADYMSTGKAIIESLIAPRSYSYSCDFPFDHQVQRELFYILRNIRI